MSNYSFVRLPDSRCCELMCVVVLGSWWNLPKVPNDLWRLCKEKDPSWEGILAVSTLLHSSVWWTSLCSELGIKLSDILYAIGFFHFCFVLQYVDHIKFCSKFKTPCRFHVVGCDTSVSRYFCHKLLYVHDCLRW